MKIKNDGEELLESFARKLVNEKGGDVNNVIEEVSDLILDELVKRLPDDRLEALDKKLESTEKLSQDQLNALVLGAGINYRDVVMGVLKTYRENYSQKEAR